MPVSVNTYLAYTCSTHKTPKLRNRCLKNERKWTNKKNENNLVYLLLLLPTSPLEVAASFSSTIPMVIAASGTRLSRKQHIRSRGEEEDGSAHTAPGRTTGPTYALTDLHMYCTYMCTEALMQTSKTICHMFDNSTKNVYSNRKGESNPSAKCHPNVWNGIKGLFEWVTSTCVILCLRDSKCSCGKTKKH